MTSIERAKSFLQRKSRLIAFTAVPLASLIAISAPTAKAGAVTPVIFSVAPCSETATGGTLSSSGCSTQQVPVSPSGIQGIKLFGSGTATAGLQLTESIGGGVQASAPLALDFFASGGTNNGSIFGFVPLHYAFSVTDTDQNTADITYRLILTANNQVYFDFTSPTAIKGNGALITGDLSTINLPPTPVLSYSIEFKVTDASATNGQQLFVMIPPTSIAIAQASGVPEPGTFALLGMALAGLGVFLRRRKR